MLATGVADEGKQKVNAATEAEKICREACSKGAQAHETLAATLPWRRVDPMVQRYDHPAVPVCPYPPGWREVANLTYETDLVLLRLKDAVKLRTGEDASYIVGADYTVSVEVDGEVFGITVPRGLLTDLTSVPAPLRSIAGRVGPWLEAAIVHDYLYIAWQDVPGRGARDRDREFADLVMLRAMEAAEVGRVKRQLIYLAVRLFGGRVFRRPNAERYATLPDHLGGFSLPRPD
jgi:hypothetical protein